MRKSLRRINALVKKELKDFTKNKNVFIICLLPIAYIFIMTSLGNEFEQAVGKIGVLNMGIGMNFTLVSTFAVSMLIAEEKEKNTMRTLMLSTVKPLEFLAGKIIVVSLFTLITNIGMYLIVGLNMQHFIAFILWSSIIMLIMMIIGGVIGLIAQNQMATGVVGLPVLMFFFLVPMLAPANDILEKIAKLLPNYNFQLILSDIFNNQGYHTYNVINIMVWVLIVLIIFAYTYNKKGLDQ